MYHTPVDRARVARAHRAAGVADVLGHPLDTTTIGMESCSLVAPGAVDMQGTTCISWDPTCKRALALD